MRRESLYKLAVLITLVPSVLFAWGWFSSSRALKGWQEKLERASRMSAIVKGYFWDCVSESKGDAQLATCLAYTYFAKCKQLNKFADRTFASTKRRREAVLQLRPLRWAATGYAYSGELPDPGMLHVRLESLCESYLKISPSQQRSLERQIRRVLAEWKDLSRWAGQLE